jgi:hypothetical protein
MITPKTYVPEIQAVTRLRLHEIPGSVRTLKGPNEDFARSNFSRSQIGRLPGGTVGSGVMIEFGVLGPLEASRGGEPVHLGGGKQRALLAILLLNANEVVSSDRLIDELWGEAAPETAGKALQVHVSQLRKALEPERGPGDPGRVLITKPPGYTLALEPD